MVVVTAPWMIPAGPPGRLTTAWAVAGPTWTAPGGCGPGTPGAPGPPGTWTPPGPAGRPRWTLAMTGRSIELAVGPQLSRFFGHLSFALESQIQPLFTITWLHKHSMQRKAGTTLLLLKLADRYLAVSAPFLIFFPTPSEPWRVPPAFPGTGSGAEQLEPGKFGQFGRTIQQGPPSDAILKHSLILYARMQHCQIFFIPPTNWDQSIWLIF